MQHANEIIQLHDMVRALEKQHKKVLISRTEMEKDMDGMTTNLKKIRDQYELCKAIELEARVALEQACKDEEKARTELAIVQHNLEEARDEAGGL